MSRDVFISYRSEDKDWAERICSALENDSLSCWVAPRDIPAGMEWATAIVENLRTCKAFIIVLSSNSKSARQIAREAELADNAGLSIITVRVEDVQPPPELEYFVGNVQWLDAFGNRFDSAMARLVQVLRATKQGQSAPVVMGAAAAQPTERLPAATVNADTTGKSATRKWVGIVAAVAVVFALGAWFAFQRVNPDGPPMNTTKTSTLVDAGPTVNSTSTTSTGSTAGDNAQGTAKAIADQFMARVQGGDVKGAWLLTSPEFKQRQPRFRKNIPDELQQDGGATGTTFKSCVSDGNDSYRCFYTLATKAKNKDATVTVAKSTLAGEPL